MKCNNCNGSGFVSIGEGIRGIKKCPVCNGVGSINYPEGETDLKSKFLRRLSENVHIIGASRLLDYDEVVKIVEDIL